MTLAVLVVNYRSHHLLERHLVPLVATLDAAVVVVDNYYDDTERAALVHLGDEHGWQVLTAPNDGFGAGVNLAADAAIGDGAQVLAVLNPDLSITAEALAALVDEVHADPNTIAAPQLVDAGRRSRAGGLDWRRGTTVALTGEPDWLSGACLVTSATLWRTLGGFAADYGMYWEDVDLCVRAQQAGARLVLRRDVAAVHEAGGTQEHAGTRRKSDLYYRANCRSRLVFAAAHLRPRARLGWALRSPAYARAVLLRGGRRQMLRSPGPLLAATAGTLSGLWYLVRHQGTRPLGRVSQPPVRRDAPGTHAGGVVVVGSTSSAALLRRLASARTGHAALARGVERHALVVMLSVPDGPHPNPYVPMLVAAVTPAVTVRMFSWRDALVGHYDVFHVQWPESLVGWRPSVRAAARCLACLALASRWALAGTPVVRTVHNLTPHEPQSWYQRVAGRLLERSEVARVHLSASSAAHDPHVPTYVIRHGRYRDWFGETPPQPAQPDAEVPTMVFFGQVRPYKGVEELLTAFAGLDRPARLRVLGKPLDERYRAHVESLVCDERVELDLRYVPDAELWPVLHQATLVVLPFRNVTNSGSLLLALDAGVPVVVSSSPAIEEVAHEVGDQWVRTYTGDLTATVLHDALTWAMAPREGSPDLSERDQATIGAQWVTLYRDVLGRRQRRRRFSAGGAGG
ncbi:MAG: glycosyltransferase [Micrococcales bacterium]|nr:glycosyltransferase [Micrococcales bacterium]MCL2667268.1 glycosyltransferase [Micrococcales bacterium]